jgi:class 3 adenylate cyclase/tetratricopeptide (TPR) repeat protein
MSGQSIPSQDLERIQRYLPEGLAQKILSQKDRIQGEMRQVTVMFCDMEGFSYIAESIGPERVYELMDKVYEILIHAVNAFGGTVNELTGDGIMALFGAPIAMEDSPQRAVCAAIDIHKKMPHISEGMCPEKDFPAVRMRIGINSGPVVVGTVGNNLRVDFKALGDTVNLASRLQTLAEPGATLVTEETFKLTEGFFRFENLGKRTIKGKSEQVRIYQVVAPRSRLTRFDVSAERGLTPLVGRTRELESLVDGMERTRQGRGQAFSIVGEAGVGKSRLLYEFRKAVANENIMFLEGKCLSYGKGSAYHPIMDILKGAFDIQDEESDSRIEEKVRYGLKSLGVDRTHTIPYILELMGVKDSGIEQIAMSSEGKRDMIIQTLKQIVLKASMIRPLVMAVEDLHWSDLSSQEVIKYMLEAIPASHVLILLTYRPDFIPNWGAKSYYNTVDIDRLSNRDCLVMAENLLGVREIENKIGDLIIDKTEGVPFFIEEFIKSLKDFKIIIKEGNKLLFSENKNLKVPSKIQDVIMTRVDCLPQIAKDIIQCGSVIEREFSYELLKQSTGFLDPELANGLSILKDTELLYERGIIPNSIYIFKHALTREVIYDSLVTKTKKGFHEAIGKAIEIIGGNNIDQLYGLMANHFITGENYIKGAEYSKLAARKAAKTGSLADAICFTRKRLNCLEKLPINDNKNDIIDARMRLGMFLAYVNFFVDAKKAIDPIFDYVAEEDKRRLGQAHTIVGAYHLNVSEDFATAIENLKIALSISSETNDVITSVTAGYWMGTLLSQDCQFGNAMKFLQRSIDVCINANYLWGMTTMKASMAFFYYFFSGRIKAGLQISSEAIEYAEMSGDSYSKGFAYSVYGVLAYSKGLFKEAEEYLLRGSHFCERSSAKMGYSAGLLCLAELFVQTGHIQKAIDYYERCYNSLEAEQMPSWRKLSKLGIIRAKSMNDKCEIDLNTLFVQMEENTQTKCTNGWISRYFAEILMNINEPNYGLAEKWIQKALDSDQSNGMRFSLGNDYAVYSELCKHQGKDSKARENLTKAIEIMNECGADGWVERYRLAL